MIRSFAHRGLERFWKTGSTAGITPHLAANIRRKLDAMHSAEKMSDLDVPGFRLHPLQGKRAGDWAIQVTGNYRLTFRWEEPTAEIKAGPIDLQIETHPAETQTDVAGPARVNLEDYH